MCVGREAVEKRQQDPQALGGSESLRVLLSLKEDWRFFVYNALCNTAGFLK
jgi:hypothetical protein